ncbi:hypothetical protein [Propionivibrio sp.]|uniref:hypothetical protein n=1 Tax=Propionivibrio sp. TaxID=2212460 RepID=UPI003BF22D24
MSVIKDIALVQGKTFTDIIRWSSSPIVRRAITGISVATGAPIIAIDTTGLPDGWPVCIVGVKGMTALNVADPEKIKDAEYHEATVLGATSVELNEINGADFKAWISGGFVQWNTPVDLTGITARQDIKDKVGGTVLLSLTTENGGITIDTSRKTFKRTIAASVLAAANWSKGVFDFEAVSNDVEPVVTALVTGKVTLSKEVTT